MLFETTGEWDRTAHFRLERVSKRLRVVMTVPEASGRLPEADAFIVQEPGVGVTEYVPAHTRGMQGTESLTKPDESPLVRELYREVETLQKLLGAWLKRYDTLTGASLRPVRPAEAGAGAPDVQDTVADVCGCEGCSLAVAEPGEQADLGKGAPWLGEALDHDYELLNREFRAARDSRWDPRPRRWNW